MSRKYIETNQYGIHMSEILNNKLGKSGDDYNAQSNKITNVATPTESGDAANKSYVDSGSFTTSTTWLSQGNISNGESVNGVTYTTNKKYLVTGRATIDLGGGQATKVMILRLNYGDTTIATSSSIAVAAGESVVLQATGFVDTTGEVSAPLVALGVSGQVLSTGVFDNGGVGISNHSYQFIEL